MRPGVEALARRGVPRSLGILLHYAGLIALLAALLSAVVPRALDQVQNAIGDLPQTRSELREEASESTGIRQRRPASASSSASSACPRRTTCSRPEPTWPSSRSRSSSGSSSCSRAPATGSSSVTGGRPRDLAAATSAAQARARHVGPDRPQARRIRPRPGAADRVRRDRPLDRVLADRAAVLAAARDLRRRGRDRSRDRALAGGSARRRRRADGLVAGRARRRHRRAGRAPDRGLHRDPARARRRRRPVAARSSSSRSPPRPSSSAASRSCSRSRSRPSPRRSSTSSCSTRTRREEDVPAVLFPAKDARRPGR